MTLLSLLTSALTKVQQTPVPEYTTQYPFELRKTKYIILKMAKLLSIQEVNALENEKFCSIFKNIVESFPKVASSIVNERPFLNADALANAAAKYLDKLPTSEREKVLLLHPDLAGRLADEGKLTTESTREQKSAGLNNLTPEEKSRMNLLNGRYQNKFGFPFVICARENKVPAILQGLATRLENSREEELGTGINEVKKICHLRVKEIVN
ncbi:hypothetical protein C0J52_11047 [Blattella germanica]|nr:hypothetical protein C0J52_11047 [Blattella germanica]